MKSSIDQTIVGLITIDRRVFTHDIMIRLSGQMSKRKKQLSTVAYGMPHVMSMAEAQHVYERGTHRLIVGTGQQGSRGNIMLSTEETDYSKRKQCHVQPLPTPCGDPGLECGRGCSD